ncbi:uncharacterized protein LOC106643668 [Copidosoma floridanum]|uniref:uncharacterized protein LOC106643668 n=1 Tax=Copidosoma floridanum TaxID=29053 RepID=UPI0006C9AFC7|nr:uncharacterized protein LOC106643668 [Copidosoma floridanum]
MDHSKQENISHLEIGPINKRRSLIFQRQSIVPKEKDLENANITEETSPETPETKRLKLESESELFDIEKYMNDLSEEDKQWREVYTKRKSRVQDLMKRDKNQEKSLDTSFLSDSERVFLKERPDYEEFNKNVFQLYAMASKVTFLNLCAENCALKSVEKLKSETVSVMHRIIQFSELE